MKRNGFYILMYSKKSFFAKKEYHIVYGLSVWHTVSMLVNSRFLFKFQKYQKMKPGKKYNFILIH